MFAQLHRLQLVLVGLVIGIVRDFSCRVHGAQLLLAQTLPKGLSNTIASKVRVGGAELPIPDELPHVKVGQLALQKGFLLLSMGSFELVKPLCHPVDTVVH